MGREIHKVKLLSGSLVRGAESLLMLDFSVIENEPFSAVSTGRNIGLLWPIATSLLSGHS